MTKHGRKHPYILSKKGGEKPIPWWDRERKIKVKEFIENLLENSITEWWVSEFSKSIGYRDTSYLKIGLTNDCLHYIIYKYKKVKLARLRNGLIKINVINSFLKKLRLWWNTRWTAFSNMSNSMVKILMHCFCLVIYKLCSLKNRLYN